MKKIIDKPPKGFEFVVIKEVYKEGWKCPECGKIVPHIMSWCDCVFKKELEGNNENKKNNY